MPRIKQIKNVEQVPLADLSRSEYGELPETLDVPRRVAYSVKRDSFWHKALAFGRKTMSGENGLGKVLGVVKNIASKTLPYGQTLDTATDLIGDELKHKPNIHAMNNSLKFENKKEKFLRILNQDSTKAALTGLLTVVGLFFSFQESISHIASVLLSSTVGITTALFGIYACYKHVRNLFSDDDKVTENK